jgi:hypothetical protein
MEDEVEAIVGEPREVGHVALDRLQIQHLALGDEPVLAELPGRVVKHGDVRARRREDRPLLPATRGETQDIRPSKIGEPVTRDRLGLGQQDLPATLSRGLDNVRAEGDVPLVAALDLAVPRFPVICSEVHQ